MFGSALVDDLINRPSASPDHGGGSTSKDGPSEGRRKRVKKHMRHLLHLSESTATETVEERKPEIVILDEREELVRLSENSVSYLTSKPIPSGKKLKKVVITVVSKDQGWSNYPDDHGTYRGSWTWFELSVGSPLKDSGEKWRGEVARNLHAHGDFKKHTVEITDRELYEKAESGDVLTVWALARYPCWRNAVKKVKIRYVVE